jgi:hypothetical protein
MMWLKALNARLIAAWCVLTSPCHLVRTRDYSSWIGLDWEMRAMMTSLLKELEKEGWCHLEKREKRKREK